MPVVTSISLSGTTLTITATNGAAGGTYYAAAEHERGAAVEPVDAGVDQQL